MSSRAWIVVGVIAVGCGSSGKPAPAAESGSPPSKTRGSDDDGTVVATAPRPPLEVKQDPPHVALPVLPAFELPAVEPGYRSVRELHVRNTVLLDTEVQLRGYVTWIYDCASAVSK